MSKSKDGNMDNDFQQWYLSVEDESGKYEKPCYKILYNKEFLELNILNNFNHFDIVIYNLLGQPIQNLNTVKTGQSLILEIDKLNKGVYFLKATIDHKIIIEKFQKTD